MKATCLNAVLLALILVVSNPANASSIKKTETAMTPGMEITATAPAGTVKIVARKGLKRSYQTATFRSSVGLKARTERWYGSLGAYYGNVHLANSVLEFFFPNLSQKHCCFEEGQLNFSSVGTALNWLSKFPAFEPRIYRNDGLCIWFNENPHCIGVNVFQIYINGSKPTYLPDAQDECIIVSGGEPNDKVTQAPMDEAEPKFIPIPGMHDQMLSNAPSG
jgi:hypothetical protein